MEQNLINKYIVPLAIIVAGTLIAGAIYFGGNTKPFAISDNTEKNPTQNSIDIAPITERDHVFGDANAELFIIEYSDTECSWCKVFHKNMHQIVSDYNGKVAWVYRHFPIARSHPRALKEAEATECAFELGGHQKFWEYIDKIFEVTNSNNSLDPLELPKIATSIGLNKDEFNACLSSNKYTTFIDKSIEDAIKAGARGTPYSVILTRDGQKIIINGAEPLLDIKAKINKLLK